MNKEETLEEVYYKVLDYLYPNCKKEMSSLQYDNSINSLKYIAKWQQEQDSQEKKAERSYSEEEVKQLLQDIINEIELRKQNIISNSKKMEIHLLEGGFMAFESSQDVVKDWFEQFKKK